MWIKRVSCEEVCWQGVLLSLLERESIEKNKAMIEKREGDYSGGNLEIE